MGVDVGDDGWLTGGWSTTGRMWWLEDVSALFIREVLVHRNGQVEYELVTRSVPDFTSKHVSGPFPTLDAAKAAYLILAPRYPGP